LLRQDDYIKSHLVTYAWRYGREYGGPKPAQMVMCAVANRVKCGQGSWLEVIANIPKYAAEYSQPEGFPSIWDQTLVRLLHEVESIYDSSGKDLTDGALFWCDLRRVETDWFRNTILGNPQQHPRIADMGPLTFFR
jgi:hypothetical protein